MSDGGVGRNDPCLCGSGRKFKRCCLLRGGYWPAIPAALSQGPARNPFCWSAAGPYGRSAPPRQHATAFDGLRPEEPDDQPKPPPPDTVPLLPVEVGLHYTYAEPFGEAEVTFIFPAGKTFLLEGDEPILVEDLKAGDRVRLKEGQTRRPSGRSLPRNYPGGKSRTSGSTHESRAMSRPPR
jgi:hypothetical protein